MNNVNSKFYKYCTNCGAKLDKNSDYCPSCGSVKDDSRYDGTQRLGAGGVGYSIHNNDKTFSTFRNRTRKVGIIVIVLIALFIFIAMLVMGASPSVALLAGGIILIIMVIALPFIFRKKKSWEGIVEKKDFYEKTHTDDYDLYKITFRTDSGKKVVQKYRSYSAVYDYLNEGDRVRYVGEIGGLYAYEKYDKSQDNVIMCPSCSYLQDPRHNYCPVCGSLLLKGN